MNKKSEIFREYKEKQKIITGIKLTVLYSVIYAGFVIVSVFRPKWMGINALFGLNLAALYGLGLILFAILLAVIYNFLCREPVENTVPGDKPGRAAEK